MSSQAVLLWALQVLGAVFGGSILLVFAHGVWLAGYRRWSAPRVARGRAVLYRLLSSPQLAPEDVEALRALPMHMRIGLLLELSRSVSGTLGAGLRDLARELGVVRKAERLTRSPFWWSRLRGARLLTALDGRETVMLPLFSDRAPSVRAQAAEWAADHPSPEVVGALLELLGDPAVLCRFTVQDSLLRLGMAASRPLADFLAVRTGPAAASALEVAAAIAQPLFLESALALCRDAHPPTRARAVFLLGAVGGLEGAQTATALLDDPDPEVRAAAAQALGRLGHWPSAPAVARLLRDPAWEARRAAGLALRELGSPGLLLLRRFRGDADRFAADMAQQVLDLSAVAEGEGR